MPCDNLRPLLRSGAAILLGATLSARAESFDKPLQNKIVDLGQSALVPKRSPEYHVRLSCSYYPKFMVKQLNDPGNKGALYVAIVTPTAGCVRAHGPGEKPFPDRCDYFYGVKRNLVFLRDCDGMSGGIGFTAFDSSTGAKVFYDLVSMRETHGLTSNLLDFVPTSNDQITLRYTRVVTGTCPVPKGGSACWNGFREQLGLPAAPIPPCTADPGDSTGDDPSVISYPVETSLFPRPFVKALAYPGKCWPAD